MTLLHKLALGQMPTQAEIDYELYAVCDSVHASCSPECPVYAIRNAVPWNDTLTNCVCFRSGKAMREFIVNNAKTITIEPILPIKNIQF